MDKGLTVPKWMLINWPKTPQMFQNLSAQTDCHSPKVWDFGEKRLHWVSVVRALNIAKCQQGTLVKKVSKYATKNQNLPNLQFLLLIYFQITLTAQKE